RRGRRVVCVWREESIKRRSNSTKPCAYCVLTRGAPLSRTRFAEKGWQHQVASSHSLSAHRREVVRELLAQSLQVRLGGLELAGIGLQRLDVLTRGAQRIGA